MEGTSGIVNMEVLLAHDCNSLPLLWECMAFLWMMQILVCRLYMLILMSVDYLPSEDWKIITV